MEAMPTDPPSPRERLGAASAPPPRRPERTPWLSRVGRFLARWLGRLVGAIAGLAVLAGLAGLIAAYGAYRHYAADLPDVVGLKSYQPPVMSRIFAGDGSLMAELATERRIYVPFTAIPERVKNAFLAAEDQNFWSHRGVDPLAILRAAVTDLSHMHEGRRPVGASTITQQLAKNMLLGNEVTMGRKIREAILALRIEQSLSKERILELYLNEIYLGQQSYGVAAAAEAYFNKPLDQLSLAEAAMLAALPKAPNNYNPFHFPEAARARRDWVLERMVETHAVTLAEARAAQAEPLVPRGFHHPDLTPDSGYFADEVHRALLARFGADVVSQGGLMVRASLDPRLQEAAEDALHAGLLNYDRAHGGWRGAVSHLPDPPSSLRANWAEKLAGVTPPPGMLPDWRLGVVLGETDRAAEIGWLEGDAPALAHTGTLLLADCAWARPLVNGALGGVPRRMRDILLPGDVVMIEPAAAPARLQLRQIPAVEGALVSLDPRTGRVLALVGGWSHAISQFDRATQANRQPGSSFKPFVYLTAMEQGISPSQRFLDAPFVVDLGDKGKWRPNNYEMDFNGPMPLHEALQHSRNLVTLRVANLLGMNAVAKTAIAFHLVDDMPRVLPAALGAVETTVLRMAGAYASLDEGGREVTPSLIDSVEDRDGHALWRTGAIGCESCAAAPDHPPLLDDTRPTIADPASVFQVVTMMEDVVSRGTGVRAGRGLNRPIAGKTGTTQDFSDAWFAGFTPDLVTVVWVGFDQPADLGKNETGGELAGPIWHDFMAEALKDHPVLPFTPPPGVTLASWSDSVQTMTDAFKDGQTPGASEPIGSPLTPPAAPAAPAEAATTPATPASGADQAASPQGTTAAATPPPAPQAEDLDKTMGGLY
jgi:penicillin-binding protein 1A